MYYKFKNMVAIIKIKTILAQTLFLLVMVLFITFSNITWLKTDNTPQGWDESIHLSAASGFASVIKSNPMSIPKAFLSRESYYPPLIPFLGSFFGLSNPEQDNFTYVMLLFHALVMIFVFLYAKKEFGIFAAFVSTALIVTYPVLFTEGHYFMLDLPLTAFLIMSVFLLEKTSYFSNRKITALLGFVAGLAMLIKWSFALYFLPPLVMYIYESRRKNSSAKAAKNKNIYISLLIFFITAAPWYIYNLLPIIINLLKYSFKRGAEEGLPPVFTIDSLIYYVKMLPSQMTLLFFLLFLLGCVLILRDKVKRKIFWYFIVPLVIFTFLHNKKNRYIMPLMPFAAIITSYIVYSIRRFHKAQACVVIVIFTMAVSNYIFSTYNLPFAWPHEKRPSSASWHIRDFLDKIGNKKATLAVVPDHPNMNNINYSYYTANFYPNIRISGIYNFPMFTDYYIIKTGDLGPSFSSADKRKVIVEKTLTPGSEYASLFDKIYELPLPDGSVGMLFKRKDTFKTNNAEFISSVNKNTFFMASLYLKNAKNLYFRITTDESGSQIKKIIFNFKEGFIGDFKHKDAGILVKNVKITINNIVLDPYSLQNNSLTILSLGSIVVGSAEVTQEDLKNFILLYAKKIEKVNVNFKDGLINISATYSKVPLRMSLRLYRATGENADICFEVKQVNIGFLPIPAGFVNFLLKDYNPLLNKSNSPVNLHFKGISAENGVLKIY